MYDTYSELEGMHTYVIPGVRHEAAKVFLWMHRPPTGISDVQCDDFNVLE
jgi:hypothetical protein